MESIFGVGMSEPCAEIDAQPRSSPTITITLGFFAALTVAAAAAVIRNDRLVSMSDLQQYRARRESGRAGQCVGIQLQLARALLPVVHARFVIDDRPRCTVRVGKVHPSFDEGSVVQFD